MMYLRLTYDHRLIDGLYGGRFLQMIVQLLEITNILITEGRIELQVLNDIPVLDHGFRQAHGLYGRDLAWGPAARSPLQGIH